MLGLRPSTNVNVQSIASDSLVKGQNVKSKVQTKITLKKGGLKVTNENVNNTLIKPKPLQASTNTIHSQKRNQQNLKQQQVNVSRLEEKLKKKSQIKNTAKTIPKVDENDVESFVGGSYNPLLDYHCLDEELYQKVLKLELADDGLPNPDLSEPFDF